MEGISDLGQPLLSGGLLDTISRFVGGNPEATKRTFEAALPTSMLAIAEHGSTEIGARSLLDGLRSGAAPQLSAQEVARTLGDPNASDRLMATSGGFLERLLGGKLGGLLDGLSSFGGLGRASASKVMALAAPLALGLIGRRASEDKLDAAGLAGFLRDQKSKVAGLVPGPIRSILAPPAPPAAPAWRDVEARATRGAAPAVVTEHRRARSPWLLAGLVALIAVGWLLSRARAPQVTGPAVPGVGAISVSRTQLPAFLASGGTGSRRFVLDGLTFEHDGSELTVESARIGDDLAGLLNAHPNARVRIEGFTDSTGDPTANQRLSLARANAVKRHLVDKGVSGDRIDTAGLGQDRPVAPNDTAAGRAQNRRVEIVVTKS